MLGNKPPYHPLYIIHIHIVYFKRIFKRLRFVHNFDFSFFVYNEIIYLNLRRYTTPLDKGVGI